MMFQCIVMSATWTLLSGSLSLFMHVSQVCGYAKESRSKPVACKSFKTRKASSSGSPASTVADCLVIAVQTQASVYKFEPYFCVVR
eukprot:2441032-Pleurochrysis_carterae.AAC.3